jgi:hypothetical protein
MSARITTTRDGFTPRQPKRWQDSTYVRTMRSPRAWVDAFLAGLSLVAFVGFLIIVWSIA